MTPIPQDLIDAVIGEVQDRKTLEACSLAASSFRWPSQRILLRSVTLDGTWSWKCGDLRNLLVKSPHIGTWIKKFAIVFPHGFEKETDFGEDIGFAEETGFRQETGFDEETLRQVFSMLGAVQTFTLRGATVFGGTAPGPAVLDFLRGRNFLQIHVVFMREISLELLSLIVFSARRISFHDSKVSRLPIGFTVSHPSTEQVVEKLVFGGSPTICDALASSAFSSSFARLRQLGLNSIGNRAHPLIAVVSRTIEHIRFLLYFYDPDLSSMPVLIAVRSIEITVRTTINIRWLPVALSAIADSYPPALEELCITYYTDQQVIQPPYLVPGIMPAVNTELMKMTALPRLRWRPEFEPADDGHHAEYFAGFSRFIELELPTFYAAGRLVVE